MAADDEKKPFHNPFAALQGQADLFDGLDLAFASSELNGQVADTQQGCGCRH